MMSKAQQDYWKGYSMEIENKALSEEEIEAVSGGASGEGTIVDSQRRNVTCPFCGAPKVFKGIRTYYDPQRGRVNEYMPYHCTECGKAWKGTYVAGNTGFQTEWQGVAEVANEY